MHVILLQLFLFAGVYAGHTQPAHAEDSQPPGIINEAQLAGVKKSAVSLDGPWKFTLNPPAGFWKDDVDPGSWDDITVPCDVFAQGLAIRQDEPFAFKRQIQIPADFAGHRILLHFGAVHNLAQVWVKGTSVATHQGGFTPWDCDITGQVQPGKPAWLAIQVTDLKREISFNGKSLRAIGGITRSVELRARPKTFFDLPIVSTPFDNAFQNATLQVVGRVTDPSKQATATFRLFDPAGAEVILKPNSIKLDGDVVTFRTEVAAPVRWDAEHPNLYRLEITVQAPGQTTATFSRDIGFRDIRFDERHNLLINGKIVKLRGTNRHLCNPTGGKVPASEYERLDVALAKEANVNFFRTSHYPPGEGLLDQCDRSGIYVTVETAVVDVGKAGRPSAGMQDDPAATRHFLSQLEEMILNYGSHPSAIIWSTSNESVYGPNFLESYKHCRKLDPSRPVIASYQIKNDLRHESYDIQSQHYPEWNIDLADVKMPTIYDEWMHVLGHTAGEWFHDPNGRDYWGRSLDKAWSNLFETDGSIGGAIWNFVDDVTYLPDPLRKSARGPQRFLNPDDVRIATPTGRGNIFGTARWGIVDEWRRKKPEFWNTKKAYSPVRLLTTRIEKFETGKDIELPVHNRFDHTDLSEITMTVTYEGIGQTGQCPALAPHARGVLAIPARNWHAGTTIHVEFFDQKKRLIDVYTISLGKEQMPAIPGLDGPVSIDKSERLLSLVGADCKYNIDPSSGLFSSVTVNGKRTPFAGPYMHLFSLEEYISSDGKKTVSYDGPELAAWKLTNLETRITDGVAHVMVKGSYDQIAVQFTYSVGANGRLDIEYAFDRIPQLQTPDKKRESNGPQTLEAGIKFRMNDRFDELAWKRTGYWSWYPEGHLGALEGRVPLFTDEKPEYRKNPAQPWEMDVHDWFYQGIDIPGGKLMPNVTKAAKMGIYEYSLIDSGAHSEVTVYGDGKTIAGRFNRARDMEYYLYILDTLDYHLRWGNYSAIYRFGAQHAGKAQLIFRTNSTEIVTGKDSR